MHVFSSTLNHRLKIRPKADSSLHTVWNNYIKYLLSIWGNQLLYGQSDSGEVLLQKTKYRKRQKDTGKFLRGRLWAWFQWKDKNLTDRMGKTPQGEWADTMQRQEVGAAVSNGDHNQHWTRNWEQGGEWERQVRRADVAKVWHREGFKVQVRCLHSVLMELKIYQYHYDSIRDAPEDKHWWQQPRTERGRGTRGQTGL